VQRRTSRGVAQARVGFRVGPGATRDIPVGRYSAAGILGDSLPAGRYYFAVVLKNRRNRLTVIPAGDAALAR
jgi:hypothetical protein